ncbi:MAG: hypothetical protein R3C97_11390, partial [Geminicoccaceae bacterium]
MTICARLFACLVFSTALLAAVGDPVDAASPQMARLIGKMKQDLGGAMEHTAVLRDEISHGPVQVSTGADPFDPMDIAGISDGGFGVTLANLRRAGDALSVRLDELNKTYRDPASFDRSETLLIMRMELTSLLWSIEELGREDPGVDREAALVRIEENLTQLDRAIVRSGE